MGEEKKSYTIHKSKEAQIDRSLSARLGLRRSLEKTTCRVDSLGELNGAEYICDTRAVDLLATRDTFKYIEKPIIWISATVSIRRDYSLLEKYVEYKVKAIVTYGLHSADMESKLKGLVTTFESIDTLEEAVQKAATMAQKGDAIVYSPSCKPHDDYQNYYDRSNVFKHIFEYLNKG